MIRAERAELWQDADEMPYRKRSKPEKFESAKRMRKNPTPAERVLWHRLQQRELHGGLKFRRQEVILGYIIDFYNTKSRVAVEVDGGIHETEAQAKWDRERDGALARRGILTLRFTNAEVFKDLDAVTARIVDICLSRKAVSRRGDRSQVTQVIESRLTQGRRQAESSVARIAGLDLGSKGQAVTREREAATAQRCQERPKPTSLGCSVATDR